MTDVETKDQEERKVISANEVLRNLPLETEDKQLLLMAVSAILGTVIEDTAKLTTATCMGYAVDDPKFIEFYTTNVERIFDTDIDSIYKDLIDMIYESEENNE